MKQIRAEVNELVHVQSLDNPNAPSYFSRVEDNAGETLSISWPLDAEIRVPYRQNELLFVSFTRQDAVYGFQAVVDETIVGPIPILLLHPTGPIQRTQRRDYVRMAALLPLELSGRLASPSTFDPNELNEGVFSIKTSTINISGGGFAFHSRFLIPAGTILDVKLTLPGSTEPLRASARVARCEDREDASKASLFRVGAQFVAIPERVRSRIIRYVFELQQTILPR